MDKILSFLFVFAAVSQIFAVSFMENFTENFDNQNPKQLNNFYFASGGNNADWAWESGVQSETEKIKVIKFAMDPKDKAGPWQGQNFTSNNFTHFGRYSARIKIPNVETQPNVGGVVGFYTYYNDIYGSGQEKDLNKNGMNDNSEIDFEWLIANPQLIYMTAWTDYEENGDCKKISRIVNLAAGKIYTTNYSEKLGSQGIELSGKESFPEEITPIENFDASKKFYVYGFDWKPESICWWIVNPENSDTIILWNYGANPERITQKPASLMFNIWHTNDWPAEDKPNSVEAPADTFWAEFNWIKYEKLEDSQNGDDQKNDSISTNLISKKQKNTNNPIKSIQKYSDRTLLTFDNIKNAKISVYSISGRKLYESEIVKNQCAVPSFRQKNIVLVKENGRIICQLSL